MDPFSLATGVVGLLSLAVDVGGSLRQYQQAFRKAPSDIQTLVSGLESLKDTLIDLDGFLKSSSAQNVTFRNTSCITTTVDQCQISLGQLLTRLRANISPKGSVSLARRLVWPFVKKEVDEAVDKLQAYTQTFQFALTLDGCKILAQTSTDVATVLRTQIETLKKTEEIAKAVPALFDTITSTIHQFHDILGLLDQIDSQTEQIQEIVTWVRDTKSKEEANTIEQLRLAELASRQALLDWISPVTFERKQDDVANARQAATGGWFLDSPAFQDWLTSPHAAVLWCPGIPGAGKTVLTSLVIDHLVERKVNASSLAYIYCDYKDPNTQDPQLIFASILRQLLEQASLIPQNLQSLHQERTRTTGKNDRYIEELTTEQCLKFILQVVGTDSVSCIVVDALDECVVYDRQDGIDTIPALLAGLRTLSAHTKLFLTSRPHIDVVSVVKDVIQLEIIADDADIRAYALSRVHDSPRLARMLEGDTILTQRVLETVVQKAAGMFLLARLQMDRLSNQVTRRGIRESLVSLPKGLFASFEDVMRRIESQVVELKELAQAVMRWIYYAKRPLKAKELQTALAIHLDEDVFDETGCPDVDMILTSCCGLVLEDGISRLVRFVHPTVQAFLEKRWQAQHHAYELYIGQACLSYLRLSAFKDISPSQRVTVQNLFDRCAHHPLLQYVVVFGFDHIRGGLEEEIATELDNVFEHPGLRTNIFQILSYSSDPSRVHLQANSPFPSTTTPLHIAAKYRLQLTVKRLLAAGHNPHIENSRYETPLSQCCNDGDMDTALTILQSSASTEIDLRNQGGIMASAAYHNRPDVASIVLSYGSKEVLDSTVSYSLYVAFMIACNRGSVAMAKLFIEQGVSVNKLKNSMLDSPLASAAGNGSVELVELLCQHGAVINEQDNPALTFAAAAGHVDVVLTLLRHGADPDLPNETKQTPLHKACIKEQWEVAKVLIENGANVNSRISSHSNAIHAAIASGNEDFIRYLISRGADMNIESEYRGTETPLLKAIELDHASPLVRMLLEAGANPFTCGFGGRDAIQNVIVRRNVANLRELWTYRSRNLTKLSSENQKETRTDMIKRWPYSEAPGGISYLSRAIYFGWREGVEILISDDFDPTRTDLFGRTAIDWAVLDPEILKALQRKLVDKQVSLRNPAESPDRKVLYTNIRFFLAMLQQDRQNTQATHHLNFLGFCFLRLRMKELSLRCFEYQATKTSPRLHYFGRPVPLGCTTCSNSIEGQRFVCLTCPLTNRCQKCMDEYDTKQRYGLCLSHEFMEVPGPEWLAREEASLKERQSQVLRVKGSIEDLYIPDEEWVRDLTLKLST